MGLIDSFLGFLGGIGNEILSILVYIFNLLVTIAQFIWNVLVAVANYVVGAFKAIGNFFAHLWTNFFKGIFTNIWKGIVSVTRWLEAHLRPIIRFLTRIRALIDRWYRLYVTPILRMIQHVRQFLLILKLLHIKIAAQLDAILSTVQRDIQSVFMEIRGVLNAAIDLLNIIADPTKLLRHPTLILSLRRSIWSLIRQITALPPAFFIPSRNTSAPLGVGKLPFAFNAADPTMNPPASYYLGLDSGVPSFSFLGPGEYPDDSAIDQVGPLEFFGMGADDTPCTDAASCMAQASRVAAGVK